VAKKKSGKSLRKAKKVGGSKLQRHTLQRNTLNRNVLNRDAGMDSDS
jgi:hypothetical protein